MATTTFDAIRDRMVDRIEALTPADLAEDLFRRGRLDIALREWVDGNGTAALLRKFEITRTGGTTRPSGIINPAVDLVVEVLTIAVTYPDLPGLYGDKGRDDMERIIRADARQVHDTVWSPGGHVDGQLRADVTIEPPTETPGVWIQTFTVLVLYHEAQTF